jgi:hypothetical protein
MYKIGFEYEGVITNTETGVITRWSNIQQGIRDKIKERAPRGYLIDPVDNYDCLAEVRVLLDANENYEPEYMLFALFRNIVAVNNAFLQNGYTIIWGEKLIPKELHNQIIGSTLDKEKCKNEKETFTFNGHYGVMRFHNNPKDFYRGGGLHINISGIDKRDYFAFIINMHRYMQSWLGHKWHSHYRDNILWRDKTINNIPVIEYMSFGLNIGALNDKREFIEMYNFVKHQFHWAQTLIQTVKKYTKENKQ